MATPTCVHPTPEALLPVFRSCFTRATIKQLLRTTSPNPRFYWRVFTPLVLLWCLILQRLQHDHSADALVSHLHTGAADALDPDDPHLQPLSKRLHSESTSAYAQGRARLPLSLIQAVNRHLVQTVQAWVAATPTPPTWKGHAVRLFDGTTFRLAPTPDLVSTYGQARNQHGDGYWVIVRSVASFCLFTQQCCGVVEARPTTSESALARPCWKQIHPTPSLSATATLGFTAWRRSRTHCSNMCCCAVKRVRRVPCCAPRATVARSPPAWIGRCSGRAALTPRSIRPCQARRCPVA